MVLQITAYRLVFYYEDGHHIFSIIFLSGGLYASDSDFFSIAPINDSPKFSVSLVNKIGSL